MDSFITCSDHPNFFFKFAKLKPSRQCRGCRLDSLMTCPFPNCPVSLSSSLRQSKSMWHVYINVQHQWFDQYDWLELIEFCTLIIFLFLDTKNIITCTICKDLIQFVDEALVDNATIAEVSSIINRPGVNTMKTIWCKLHQNWFQSW